MKRRSSMETKARRQAVPLSNDLEHRLASYALAVSAAGMTLLAAAPPAHADIVYTPKSGRLTSGKLLLDLNLDGVPDFELSVHSQRTFVSRYASAATAKVTLGGSASASVRSSNNSAAVLVSGALIGSSRKFRGVSPQVAQLACARRVQQRGSEFFSPSGNWENVQDKYLGLRFKINGETHYGWAKLSVKYREFIHQAYTVKVEGFAYETVPDQPILAGQTVEGQIGESGPDNSPQTGNLGALALGAPGLDIWRREASR